MAAVWSIDLRGAGEGAEKLRGFCSLSGQGSQKRGIMVHWRWTEIVRLGMRFEDRPAMMELERIQRMNPRCLSQATKGLGSAIYLNKEHWQGKNLAEVFLGLRWMNVKYQPTGPFPLAHTHPFSRDHTHITSLPECFYLFVCF